MICHPDNPYGCRATDQADYDDVTCGHCDRPLMNMGDRTEVCNCL